jgi:hypothetical protein
VGSSAAWRQSAARISGGVGSMAAAFTQGAFRSSPVVAALPDGVVTLISNAGVFACLLWPVSG